MKLRTIVFLAVVLAVETFYALYNPPYDNPDERSHLQCAAFYRDEGRLPDPYDEAEKIQQDKHPPYTYVLCAAVLRWTEGWFTDPAASFRLPGPYERSWTPGRVQKVMLDAARRGVADGQLLLLRFLMGLHWIVAAFFLLRIADLVRPRRPRYAFSVALSCALIPQAAMGGAAVTPDTPLAAFSTAAFYFFLRAALGRDSARRAGLAGGVFLALALLCKSAAVYLLPVLVVAAVLRWRTGRRPRDGLAFAAWAVLLPLVLAAWWYARNTILYGDPFQMRAQVEAYTHSIRREPLTSTFFEAFFWDVFRTFFGFYDRALLLPRPVFFVLAGICGVATLGLGLLLRRPIRSEATTEELRALPLALTAVAVLSVLVLAGNLTVPSAQGRYLYPALGGFLVLLGTGLGIGMRLRRDPKAAYVAAAAWVAFGVWAFHWAVLRHETVSRARAAGEGGVVFYEDCGSPNLCPHRVQGYAAPDAGQLGRIVPWRTLDGHAEAVVYDFPIAPEHRHDLQVRVTYFNPDPTTPYVAFETGRFAYTSQRLRADGSLLHDEIEVTSQPKELVFHVPERLVDDGELELRFEKVAGIAAVVSEIWIEAPWVAFEPGPVRGRVVNRTGRTLRCQVLWGEGGRAGSRQATIGPQGSVALSPPFPARPDRVQVLALDLSPWMLREAEAHPAPGKAGRWVGALDASGGYGMHGNGVLAVLGFGSVPEGPVVLLARVKRGDTPWMLRRVPASALTKEGVLEYRSPRGVAESLDYVVLTGGWRP